MRIDLLGPFELVVDDRAVAVPGAGERALLALLALDVGSVVPAERLIDAMWGEDLPSHPSNALQTRVSKLRRIVGDVVQTRPPGYLLAVDADAVDVHRFRRLVASGLPREALALWRGPALADLSGADWAVPIATRLEQERLAALEQRLDADLSLGRHGDVIAELAALVAEQPLRERFREQLMLALYRAGRQVEALDVFRDARAVLADELGLDPGPALQELEAAILRQDPALSAPAPAADPAVLRLPVALTEVLGREPDLARAAATLRDHRLVTLTGPGGTGKTTVAVELARRRAGEHLGGVWFAPLAEVTDPQRVADVVLATLGVVAPDAPSARDLLAGYLADRRGLLVLDNCEHVVDAAADLALHLLSTSRQLRILTTSRTALGVPGEVQLPLPPLPADAAVALFAARAQAVDPAFELDPDTRPAVTKICERLDRMPLAVELAAVRARSLPVTVIAERLDDRFTLLAAGPRTAEARHRTLQATVDWSHQLLDAPERVLFRRLAVFAGSWSLQDAEAVCGDQTLPRHQVLDVLDRLVGQSLVVAEAGRFTLLETIRVYAADRLADSPDAQVLAARHAQHFTQLAERAEHGLRGAEQSQWLALLRANSANLRAALAWSRGRAADDPDALLRLAAALAWFWFVGRHREGREELTAALAVARGASPYARGRALQALSIVERPGGCIVHPSPRAHASAEESLALFRGLGDRHRALISEVLCSVEAVGGVDVPDTVAWLQDAARELVELGDEWAAALAEFVAVEIQVRQGTLDEAVQLAERVADRFRRIGDRWGTSAVLSHIGQGLRLAGRVDAARAALDEALRQARDAGLHNTVAGVLVDLAALDLMTGDVDRVEARAREALPLTEELGNAAFGAAAQVVLAHAAYLRHAYDEAAALAEAALDAARREGVAVTASRAAALLAMLALRAGRVGAQGYADEALSLARAAHDAALEARALEVTAAVRTSQGDAEGTAALLATAGRLRAQRVRPPDIVEAADASETASRCRDQAGGAGGVAPPGAAAAQATS